MTSPTSDNMLPVEEVAAQHGPKETLRKLMIGAIGVVHRGFMEEVDIPRDLAFIKSCGEPFNMMSTSFFLCRQKLVASAKYAGMAPWRERLFA